MTCVCGHKSHKPQAGGCNDPTCTCRRLRPKALGGMTIREAAPEAGLSPSMISRFLRGERSLSYEALARLSETVHKQPEDLLAEVGK